MGGQQDETTSLPADEHEDRSTVAKPNDGETQPLLSNPHSQGSSIHDHQAHVGQQELPKQLSTRHAFAVLVSIQIGSGIFASPAQVDSNAPSPGIALIIWVIGGGLSWAGAASFAELGAALPLNGGMQEYLRHVYGDTVAFLMAWIYIMAVKPSSMAIQSIVIIESVVSVLNPTTPLADWKFKLFAVFSFLCMVLLNSINTKFTMRLSESFTFVKITTVVMIVIGGIIAFATHFTSPDSSLAGSKDWYTKNWFHARPSVFGGQAVEWDKISTWELLGHLSAAIYAGLWAYDGWDNANFVANEIQNPGRSLPLAIKAAMTVVLTCYELVNISYYILLPWDMLSLNDAVAVAAAQSLLGHVAGVIVTLLVAISCAGAITSNLFAVGRLTVAASQRHYLPRFFSHMGMPCISSHRSASDFDSPTQSNWDAPIYANVLAMIVTIIYIITGSFRALLTFVGMAEWVFYVSTVIGLIILRSREPDLTRPYKPPLLIPIIFAVVGLAVILRSMMFAPMQSTALAALLGVGFLVGRLRTR